MQSQKGIKLHAPDKLPIVGGGAFREKIVTDKKITPAKTGAFSMTYCIMCVQTVCASAELNGISAGISYEAKPLFTS